MKKLVFSGQAKADLAGLDRSTSLRIAAALQRLALTGAGDIKKLQGIDPLEFRLRGGDIRIRFSQPDAQTIQVNRIQNRREAYR